jgi:hypothetical protein
MPCSLCKQSGHNARTCSAPAPAKVVKAPKAPKAVKAPKPAKPAVAPERTKRNAKANEDADINFLIAAINSPTSEVGKALRDGFFTRFGAILDGARRSDPSVRGAGGRGGSAGGRGGDRKAHYDFQIHVVYPDGRDAWLKVEHKGSKKYAPIDTTLPPWTGGVQFSNGGMELYRMGLLYAKAWYAKYVGSGVLKARYGIVAPIPDLKTWIAKDAKSQGDPKTPFGRELKEKYRARPGCEKKSLMAERDAFVADFATVYDAGDCDRLKEDTLSIAKGVLDEKDVWLQIAGDVNGLFHFAWRPRIHISRVDSVERTACSDIAFIVHSDCEFPFMAKIRWGEGAGFSNLRCDLL